MGSLSNIAQNNRSIKAHTAVPISRELLVDVEGTNDLPSKLITKRRGMKDALNIGYGGIDAIAWTGKNLSARHLPFSPNW